MAYDDNIELPQGAPKLSEVALDRPQPVIEMPEHANALTVIEQLRKIATDALTRVNYLLHSDGRIRWDGGKIYFNSDGQTNDAIFKMLQTEEAVPRTINFNIKGSITGNTSNTFEEIELADRELLYIEIDRQVLLDSTTGEVQVENAVGGGSLQSGYTLKKTTLSASTGMPPLKSPLVGSTLTLSVPLCMRWDWSDGVQTYKDLWWIPHGIRWPEDVNSTLGAVIAKGLEFYPTVFVHTVAEFIQAVADTGGQGGIICIVEPFTLDQSITIPTGVTLLGRTSTVNPSNKSAINFLPGGRLDMGYGTTIKDLAFFASSSFGATIPEYMIHMNGNRGIVENCSFIAANTAGTSYGINVVSGYNQIRDCRFQTAEFRYGIWYSNSTFNTDRNSDFANSTYARVFESTISQVDNGPIDDPVVRRTIQSAPPPGTIMPFIGGYFTNGSNAGFANVLGNDAATINTWLDANGYRNWRVCDGANLNDSESLIYDGTGRYLPNLTDDRFLMGDSAAGIPGGTNDSSHLHSVPIHGHANTLTFTVSKHYHSASASASNDLSTGPGGSHYHYTFRSGVTSTIRHLTSSNYPRQGLSVGGVADYTIHAQLAEPDLGRTNLVSSHSHAVIGYAGPQGQSGAVSGDSNIAATKGGSVTDKTAFNTVSAGSASSNLPKYLSCFYIQCVK